MLKLLALLSKGTKPAGSDLTVRRKLLFWRLPRAPTCACYQDTTARPKYAISRRLTTNIILSVHFVTIKKWKSRFSHRLLRVGGTGYDRIICLFGNHVNNASFLLRHVQPSCLGTCLPYRYLLAVLCLWPVRCASFPLKNSTHVSVQKFFGKRAFTTWHAQPAVMFFSSSNTFLTEEGRYRVSLLATLLHAQECYRHRLSCETRWLASNVWDPLKTP